MKNLLIATVLASNITALAEASTRRFYGGISFSTPQCKYAGKIEAQVDDQLQVRGTVEYGTPLKIKRPLAGSLNKSQTELTLTTDQLKMTSDGSSKELEKTQGVYYGGTNYEGTAPTLSPKCGKPVAPQDGSWGGYLK